MGLSFVILPFEHRPELLDATCFKDGGTGVRAGRKAVIPIPSPRHGNSRFGWRESATPSPPLPGLGDAVENGPRRDS